MTLKGTFAELPLSHLVEVTALTGKTGRLDIFAVGGDHVGSLDFVEGRLVGAVSGALEGEQAFYAVLALHEGEFAFDPDAELGAGGIDAPTAALLVEGMRRVDETIRLRALMPAPARLSLQDGTATDENERLVLAYLGPGARSVGDIVDGIVVTGTTGEYDVLAAIDRLMTRGVVALSATAPQQRRGA
jgi:hypothetical protein